MSFPIWDIFQGITTLFSSEPAISGLRIFLIFLGFLLIYLGFKQVLEPLLMLPMGFGMIAVNAGVLIIGSGQTGTLFAQPLAEDVEQLMYYLQVDFLQPIYNFTFSNGLIAILIFMGIGAITDIDYLIAKPVTSLLLAVCAELGTILTLPIAVAMGFLPTEAAAIALVGGADGPMVLYGSISMARHLFVPISVVAYIYLGVVYAGYPYLIKLLVPKRLRGIEMDAFDMPEISSSKKFTFAVIAGAVLCLLFPVAAPLFAAFFLGVAIKEAGILRYIEFLSQPLLYGATLFLGFTLGALLSAEIILDPKVLKLVFLGVVALALSGVGGLAGGLIAYKLSKGKFNPLVGIAAVSCIPTTAKVAQKCAAEANSRCMILPHAMGPSVAGVITTAILTGIYISSIKFVG